MDLHLALGMRVGQRVAGWALNEEDGEREAAQASQAEGPIHSHFPHFRQSTAHPVSQMAKLRLWV